MKVIDFIKKQKQNPWFIIAMSSVAVLIVVSVASIVIINTRSSDTTLVEQLESEKNAALLELQTLDYEISALESKIAPLGDSEEKAKIEAEIEAKRSVRLELNEKVSNIENKIQEEKTSGNIPPQDSPSQNQPEQNNQQDTTTNDTSNGTNNALNNESSNQESGQPSYIPVSKIEINCPSDDVHPHTSMDLTATIYPSNATDQNLYWTSSNPAVASLSSPYSNYQSFNIDAIGVTTMTITAADDVSATCTLNSTALAIQDFIIKPQNDKTIFNKGEQNLLIVEFEPYFTTNRTIYWSSSDNSIATVERIEGGYVMYKDQLWSVSEGSALVTFGDKEGRVEITAISDEGGITKVIRYNNYQR